MRTYLLSTNALKQNTAINQNVDDNLLLNAIWEAQEINVQQTCGSRLYKKIVSLVANNTIGSAGNANYKTLLDEYITPIINYYAWMNALVYISYKSMNKGLQTQNSDNSQSASMSEMQFVRDDIRNKAEFFAQRLSDYLHANRSLYPEYNNNSGIDEMTPNHNQYSCGIVFDHDSCKCNIR